MAASAFLPALRDWVFSDVLDEIWQKKECSLTF